MCLLYGCGAEELLVNCDICDAQIRVEGFFVECIEEVKQKGWYIFKRGDKDYDCLCPKHKIEFNN